MNLSAVTRIDPSRIREIAQLADRVPGTLRLFFGEDTEPTPEFIRRAGQRAIAEGKTFYTPNAGYPELRAAISEHVQIHHGPLYDPDREIVVTASGMMGLNLAARATLSPSDSALVITPLWPNVAAVIELAGAEVIPVPLDRVEQGFTLDFDRLRSSLRSNTRLLAVTSPGNPTGWTATSEQWRELVRFCHDHDLWLLADKVYERISFREPIAPGPLQWPEGRERTIVIQSFSKAYRMTGWRVGYALANPTLATALWQMQEFVVSHASGIAQEAARTALIEGEPFIAQSLARYRHHREMTLSRLGGLAGIQLARPDGAFYVFAQLDGVSDSFAFCREMVQQCQVGFAPGNAFGSAGEGAIRICFAVDETTLKTALDRFAEYWVSQRPKLARS